MAEFERIPLILSPTLLQQTKGPPTNPRRGHLFIKRNDLTGLAFGGNKG